MEGMPSQQQSHDEVVLSSSRSFARCRTYIDNVTMKEDADAV